MAEDLLRDEISHAAVDSRRPDDTPYRSLSSAAVDRLARDGASSMRRVEQIALEMGIVPERYTRNMTTLSPEDQHRLLDCTVCVLGVGGLGGTVAEILARIGVGHLRLVDGDHFEDSNLNRQRFADASSLGHSKVQVARKKLAAINPAVEVTALGDRLGAENGAAILGEAHIAVDCLDTLQARRHLQSACRSAKIPMISAAVAGVSGQMTVIYPEDLGLAAFYGDLTTAADRGAETTLGNLPFAVNMVASLECSEAIKILLKKGNTLRNRLIVFDLAEPHFDIIDIA